MLSPSTSQEPLPLLDRLGLSVFDSLLSVGQGDKGANPGREVERFVEGGRGAVGRGGGMDFEPEGCFGGGGSGLCPCTPSCELIVLRALPMRLPEPSSPRHQNLLEIHHSQEKGVTFV